MKQYCLQLPLFFLIGQISPIPTVASNVSVKAVAIEPAISALDTESLIARLQFETQSVVALLDASGKETGLTVEVPARARGFLPLDVQPDWERRLRRESKSPVMTELVRRGVTALPQLLRRLNDTRPTMLVTRGPDFGTVAFGDQYDARYHDPSRQPAGVNTIGRSGERSLSSLDTYIYTVGDLCYLAVLNIVNRRESPPGSGSMGNASVIHSPTRYPALVSAMRKDWTGLTAQEHEAGLRADALELNPDGSPGIRSSGAVQRLLFYYPEAGREVAETLLRRELGADAIKSDPPRWLAESYSLMNDLGAYEWEGLDDIVFAIFKSAVRLPDFNGELTMICARRLAGRGRDEELRKWLGVLIAGNEAIVRRDSTLQSERRVRAQANESYRNFLRTLAAK